MVNYKKEVIRYRKIMKANDNREVEEPRCVNLLAKDLTQAELFSLEHEATNKDLTEILQKHTDNITAVLKQEQTLP